MSSIENNKSILRVLLPKLTQRQKNAFGVRYGAIETMSAKDLDSAVDSCSKAVNQNNINNFR